MSTWLTIDEFRQQFRPPPKAETVLAWVDSGALEKWQPGGRGGKIYVRPREDGRPESEQQLLEALRAAEEAQPRKRRA